VFVWYNHETAHNHGRYPRFRLPSRNAVTATPPIPAAQPPRDQRIGEPLRVGPAIRIARTRMGLSLGDLADAVGCAKSYLSAVENEHRSPPSLGVLARIERALHLEEGSLVVAACWQRSIEAGGEPLRRDLEALRRQQAAGERLGSLLASRGNPRGLDDAYRSGELQRLVDQLTPRAEEPAPSAPAVRSPMVAPQVPVINSVAAGYPTEFTDLGYPARVADDYVRCPDVADPDAFGARVVGDSMSPTYIEGDVVVFSPAKTVRSGMDCFVRFERDAQTTFKRVYFENDDGERIRLQPLNASYPPVTLDREDVAGLYAAVSVIRRIGG